ncbi:MAG: phosphoribosylformylglycinamidine synthase subunit PurL [Thermodesulfobacteriota bacterium]
MEITEKIVKEHGLSPDEYAKILRILDREPTIVELGIFSVMWSEHCSYKSSRKYLKGFPTEGPYVLQGPGENAGIVDIGDGFAVAFKMESHNHPSFIEPYQGAATGVGGILRDIFTMGARPFASLNSLRFGSFENARTAFLVDGVTAGIAGYGNCMGVPTVGGEAYFNESYNGNCLVNVMTAGLVRKDRIFRGNASGVGNPVIYVGSRTGRDGIHGAVMASDVFGEGGEERRPTVQVGDPFAEKLLLEACLELFKTDYVVGIQDMGAAGLTSSSVEMASRAGTGLDIDIDRVPRREDAMSAYEIMLSESQERMLMVVHKGVEAKVREIFEKWDLDAEVIGTVTEGGSIRITEDGKTVADIPVAALTDEAPVYDRPVERPASQDALNTLDLNSIKEPDSYDDTLITLLSSPNIASKEWIYRQYDHMVRTDTVVLPGSDAAVVRVKGTKKGLGLTVDCNSRYCYLDPRTGARIAVAEASRNLAASGARAIALTDCLNFGNPENPGVMWQFKEAVEGIKEACVALGVPVIGGNVSFYNETSGVSIHPTPTIGMVGLIEDLRMRTTQWFKGEGDLVAMLGGVEGTEIGGSEYLKAVHGIERGQAPRIDLEFEKNVQEACLRAINECIILSAHDVSEGGLAVALAECCLDPDSPVGASVEAGTQGARADVALFGETQSRMIVSLKEKDLPALEAVCASLGVPLRAIGKTGGASLTISGLVDAGLDLMEKAFRGSLEGRLAAV